MLANTVSAFREEMRAITKLYPFYVATTMAQLAKLTFQTLMESDASLGIVPPSMGSWHVTNEFIIKINRRVFFQRVMGT